MKFILTFLFLISCNFLQAQIISGPAGSYNSNLILTTPGPIVLPFPWTGPAGTFAFTAPSAVTVTQTSNSITFTWGAMPPPVPPPTPTPTPITTHLYALAVFDSTNNTANDAQKAIDQVNLPFVADLKALNCDFAFCDKSSSDFSTWIPSKFSDGSPVTWPALVIISVNPGTNAGEQIEAIPLSTDGSLGVITEVKKLRTIGKQVKK